MSGSVPLTWETARPLVPELALITATIAYGATFKLVQDALDDVTPVGFILLRFSMGAIVLLPFAIRNGWRGPSTARASLRRKDFLLAVLAFGVVGFAGYWFQNDGPATHDDVELRVHHRTVRRVHAALETVGHAAPPVAQRR